MLHQVKNIATSANFDPLHFEAYCKAPQVFKVFSLIEERTIIFVSTWYVDELLKAYKNQHYHNFLDYVTALGYTPLKARITPLGYEADLDKSDVPVLEHFTSFNNKTVRLSFKDITNKGILKEFAFA